jgi:hypothetical protein
MKANMEDLSLCPGVGEKKVKRLYQTFHQPFKLYAGPKDKVAKLEQTKLTIDKPQPQPQQKQPSIVLPFDDVPKADKVDMLPGLPDKEKGTKKGEWEDDKEEVPLLSFKLQKKKPKDSQ